jgi:hypothetical protein
MYHEWGEVKWIGNFIVGTHTACEKVDSCRIGDEI